MTPDVCVCGHTTGDHASNRAPWPHPMSFGVCLVKGCGCKRFDVPDLHGYDAERDRYSEVGPYEAFPRRHITSPQGDIARPHSQLSSLAPSSSQPDVAPAASGTGEDLPSAA